MHLVSQSKKKKRKSLIDWTQGKKPERQESLLGIEDVVGPFFKVILDNTRQDEEPFYLSLSLSSIKDYCKEEEGEP